MALLLTTPKWAKTRIFFLRFASDAGHGALVVLLMQSGIGGSVKKDGFDSVRASSMSCSLLDLRLSRLRALCFQNAMPTDAVKPNVTEQLSKYQDKYNLKSWYRHVGIWLKMSVPF